MANLLYRASTTPAVPSSTTAKSAPLTNLEVDGNFKSINDELILKAPIASPTFTGDVVVNSITAVRLPVGTTAERPSTGLSGHLRFNTTSTQFEGFDGTAWSSVGGAVLSDDTTTNTTYYPTLANATTGTALTLRVTSTKLYFNPSTGTLNATNFNSLSDITLKENVVLIQNATDTINSIDGVEFEWKDNGNKSSGVIAQKLEEILPHLVETSADGIKSVNYSGLVAYLIEAVKQQDSRIRQLEDSINK